MHSAFFYCLCLLASFHPLMMSLPCYLFRIPLKEKTNTDPSLEKFQSTNFGGPPRRRLWWRSSVPLSRSSMFQSIGLSYWCILFFFPSRLWSSAFSTWLNTAMCLGAQQNERINHQVRPPVPSQPPQQLASHKCQWSHTRRGEEDTMILRRTRSSTPLDKEWTYESLGCSRSKWTLIPFFWFGPYFSLHRQP